MGEKDYQKPTSVRIPTGLKKDLEEIAEKQGRSLSNLILYYLREAVKKDKAAAEEK